MITPVGGMSHATITQEDLEVFVAIREELSAIKWRYEQERNRLIGLADALAPVEPGRLNIAVVAYENRRITSAFLIDVLGSERFQHLRAKAVPTICRRLVVDERGRKSAPTAKGGES